MTERRTDTSHSTLMPRAQTVYGATVWSADPVRRSSPRTPAWVGASIDPVKARSGQDDSKERDVPNARCDHETDHPDSG
jgi:hypothetical protein